MNHLFLSFKDSAPLVKMVVYLFRNRLFFTLAIAVLQSFITEGKIYLKCSVSTVFQNQYILTNIYIYESVLINDLISVRAIDEIPVIKRYSGTIICNYSYLFEIITEYNIDNRWKIL